MIKDLRQLLIILFPLILLITLVNYNIDPGNIFKTRRFEKNIEKTLQSGRNAAFAITMSQVDEVKLLRDTIQTFSKPKHLVVIGSSRSFAINSSLFPNTSFYNASISSCSLADMFAIYHLFEKAHLEPKNIILSIDPEFFISDYFPRDELYDDFHAASKVMGIKFSKRKLIIQQLTRMQNRLMKFLEVVSPAYFQNSIKFLLFSQNKIPFKELEKGQGINLKKMTWWDTTDITAPGGIIFPDGSREWSQFSLAMDENTKKTVVLKQIEESKRFRLKNQRIKDRNQFIFKHFIEHLQKNNIHVVFFLSPYHPISHNYERKKFKHPITINCEKYIRELANAYHIKVIGSYKLKPLGLKAEDMLDEHHIKREAAVKIFNQAKN